MIEAGGAARRTACCSGGRSGPSAPIEGSSVCRHERRRLARNRLVSLAVGHLLRPEPGRLQPQSAAPRAARLAPKLRCHQVLPWPVAWISRRPAPGMVRAAAAHLHRLRSPGAAAARHRPPGRRRAPRRDCSQRVRASRPRVLGACPPGPSRAGSRTAPSRARGNRGRPAARLAAAGRPSRRTLRASGPRPRRRARCALKRGSFEP